MQRKKRVSFMAKGKRVSFNTRPTNQPYRKGPNDPGDVRYCPICQKRFYERGVTQAQIDFSLIGHMNRVHKI